MQASSLKPQLHKSNRLYAVGRVMGDSPGIHGTLMGAAPASAGPRNISQAYGKPAKGSLPVLEPPWKLGQRRSALIGRQSTVRPALSENRTGRASHLCH